MHIFLFFFLIIMHFTYIFSSSKTQTRKNTKEIVNEYFLKKYLRSDFMKKKVIGSYKKVYEAGWGHEIIIGISKIIYLYPYYFYGWGLGMIPPSPLRRFLCVFSD